MILAGSVSWVWSGGSLAAVDSHRVFKWRKTMQNLAGFLLQQLDEPLRPKFLLRFPSHTSDSLLMLVLTD